MFMKNMFKFLIKPFLNANYINNNTSLYIILSIICFYIFIIKSYLIIFSIVITIIDIKKTMILL
jgi:hypothetical protein